MALNKKCFIRWLMMGIGFSSIGQVLAYSTYPNPPKKPVMERFARLNPATEIPQDFEQIVWKTKGTIDGVVVTNSHVPVWSFDLLGRRYRAGSVPINTTISLDTAFRVFGQTNYFALKPGQGIVQSANTRRPMSKRLENQGDTLMYISGRFLQPSGYSSHAQ